MARSADSALAAFGQLVLDFFTPPPALHNTPETGAAQAVNTAEIAKSHPENPLADPIQNPALELPVLAHPQATHRMRLNGQLVAYQLVRSKRNLHLQDEEILAYLQDVPGFRKDFIFYEDGILADELRSHIEDFKDLQKDAAYYIPSEAEILQLQTEPLITGKQDRQNIGRFLCDKAGLSLEQTQVILNKICGLCAYGMFPENVKDILQQENIWPKLVFGQIDEFMHLLTTLGLHTRALIHRGFTPEEVMQGRQKTGDAYEKKTKKSASPKVVYMRDYQKDR